MGVLEEKKGDLSLSDFSLEFCCCFSNLVECDFVGLVNKFRMEEKC